MAGPSLPRWLTRPVALVLVPLLAAAAYGGAWAVRGAPPFVGSATCEPSSGPSPSDPSPTGFPATSSDDGDARLALVFGFRPNPLQPRAPVTWSFSITNVSSEPVTLTFNSGKDGDVVMLRDGEERYRWSDGKTFTQALRTVELGPEESHSFALEDVVSVEPGDYELVATVASTPAPSSARRTVSVDAEPSASPTPTGSPTEPATSGSEGSPTPTPTASETAATTPTPTPSPTMSPRRVLRRPSRARRRRTRRARSLLVATIATAAFWLPAGAVSAQEGGSGGKNVVIVLNETDGRTASRAGVLVGTAASPSAIPENLASARASCTDCRTVAVAMQAVLVTGDPDVASPRNAAVAANGGCTRCTTVAYAWQYVVSTGGPVRITPDGHAKIASLRARAAELAGSALAVDALVRALDGVASEFRNVIDSETVGVGARAVADRAVDADRPVC